MVSEISLNNIWSIFWPKNHQNSPALRFRRSFGGCSAKIGVKCYPNSILRPYLESSHQGDLYTLSMIAGLKIYFLNSCRIFKILSVVRKPKKVVFYGRTKALFCYSHPMTRDYPRKPGKRWGRWKMKRPNEQWIEGLVYPNQYFLN